MTTNLEQKFFKCFRIEPLLYVIVNVLNVMQGNIINDKRRANKII